MIHAVAHRLMDHLVWSEQPDVQQRGDLRVKENRIVPRDGILVASKIGEAIIQEMLDPCCSLFMRYGIKEILCLSRMIREIKLCIFSGF